MSIIKNVFRLNEVHDLVGAGTIRYDVDFDAGTLWAWGAGTRGQLAQNNIIDYSSPVQIPGTSWCSFSAGYQHSLATKSDGTLWTWGLNTTGEMGLNDRVHRSSPTQIPGTAWCIVSTNARDSANFVLATKSDGTLWGWGYNYGTLGVNDKVNRCSPTQIPGTAWIDTCAAGKTSHGRKSDGTLWGWGGGPGSVGDGTNTKRSSPVQVPGTQWTMVSGGRCHTLALKSDGTLWSWGGNREGQLADGTCINKSSPVQIPGNTWVDVKAGHLHSLGLKTDGTVWGWGVGDNGRLANNLNTGAYTLGYSSPIQIPGSWKDISGGNTHTLLRKSDCTLWSTGINNAGELGDNTCANRSSPIQIPGRWIDVFGGSGHTLAKKCA